MSDVNFTPTRGAYKELTPFRYWCQKVLPLVYDDSISYYELLCKVVNYLNITMEDVGTLNDDVTAMYTAYDELQDFVNQYFTDLNVQTQIDNKLDRMAADGSLNALIDPVVTQVTINSVAGALPDVVEDQLPDVVEDQITGVVENQIGGEVAQQIATPVNTWLTQNLSQPTNVVLDQTVTISGAAPDAYQTGKLFDDLIADGRANILSYFQSGNIIVANNISADRASYGTVFIGQSPIPANRVAIIPASAGDNFTYVINNIVNAEYNIDYVFYAFVNNGREDETTHFYTYDVLEGSMLAPSDHDAHTPQSNGGMHTITAPAGTEYVIFQCLYETATIGGDWFSPNTYIKNRLEQKIIPALSDLKADLYENERFNKYEWENGAISASTGANVSNSSRIRTRSFLPWGVARLHSTNPNIRFLIYAYDSTGAYVGGWWNDGTFNPSDVYAVSSFNFNTVYANPDYAGYQYRVCIHINNGTARVETISDVYMVSLSIADYIGGNLNLTLNRLEQIKDNTNLDDLTTAGNYYIANSSSLGTITNRPLFASTGGRIFVLYIISQIRPLQIYLGYNSTGSPVIYVRFMGASGWYPWQRMYGRTARNLRVLGFNLGKFNYGRDGGLAEDVETKIANFKKFIGNINPDITLTCECSTYIDASETYQTIPTIFTPLYNKYASFNECAVFADAFESAKLETDGGIYLRDDLNTYAGQVARQIIEIDGKQLLMSGGFLRVLGTETERYQAFVNYLASITNYDYSIIYLDTNVLSEAERVNLANAATEAGYTICNGGYFGLIPTLHSESMFRPIDNIFVKGNIKVKNFYAASDAYNDLSSDHYAVIADLALY